MPNVASPVADEKVFGLNTNCFYHIFLAFLESVKMIKEGAALNP